MARQRGAKWQGDGRDAHGRRVRKLFATRAEAEAFESQTVLGDTTVGHLFTSALNHYYTGTLNEAAASSHTKEFLRYFGEETPVSTFDTRKVRAYVSWCKAKANTDATINRKLMTLRKYLRYCIDEKVLDTMPQIETKRELGGRLRFITTTEEDAIFAHLSHESRALCQFLLYTGCRLSEALKLTWSDVQANSVTFWITKNGKPRTVPLVHEAKQALEMVSGRVQPFKVRYEQLRYDWHRAKAMAGVNDKEVVIHTLRHTCASRLVMAGADIRRVKDWLGHLSIDTTLRYAHLAPDSLHDVAHLLTRVDTTTNPVPHAARHLPGVNPDGGMSRVAKGADCKSAGVPRS
jgi:site-specific recombinase XerD